MNALQRKAAVVLQKSIREGFGLTVAEAMWKGTPVIGGNVGGIRHQIAEGVNGSWSPPSRKLPSGSSWFCEMNNCERVWGNKRGRP